MNIGKRLLVPMVPIYWPASGGSSRETRMIKSVEVLVALALAVASLALIAPETFDDLIKGTAEDAKAESARAPHEDCYWLNLELLSEDTHEATRDGLDSRGWYDDPTDSIDALYSPGCGAVGEMGGEA